jgi:hypothetical protein
MEVTRVSRDGDLRLGSFKQESNKQKNLATALWLHALPVEVVIPRLRRVVEERLHLCV